MALVSVSLPDSKFLESLGLGPIHLPDPPFLSWMSSECKRVTGPSREVHL